MIRNYGTIGRNGRNENANADDPDALIGLIHQAG
jgi:hypothetical protein